MKFKVIFEAIWTISLLKAPEKTLDSDLPRGLRTWARKAETTPYLDVLVCEFHTWQRLLLSKQQLWLWSSSCRKPLLWLLLLPLLLGSLFVPDFFLWYHYLQSKRIWFLEFLVLCLLVLFSCSKIEVKIQLPKGIGHAQWDAKQQ